MRAHIPNTITLLNLLCGCAALLSILHLEFYATAWWLVGAAFADFADGLAARALKVQSPVGKELDSLADAISFGLVPATILYVLLTLGPDPAANASLLDTGIHWPAFPAFLVAAFSVLRLGRFNLDTRQTDDFIGLPTPANTILILGILLLYVQNTFNCQAWLGHPVTLYGLIVILCWLLNAEIPMFSLKIKHFGWSGNELRYILAGAALPLLIWLRETALAPIMLLYILLNLGVHLFADKKDR